MDQPSSENRVGVGCSYQKSVYNPTTNIPLSLGTSLRASAYPLLCNGCFSRVKSKACSTKKVRNGFISILLWLGVYFPCLQDTSSRQCHLVGPKSTGLHPRRGRGGCSQRACNSQSLLQDSMIVEKEGIKPHTLFSKTFLNCMASLGTGDSGS